MVQYYRPPPAQCREHDGAELGPRAGQPGPDPGGPVRVQPRVLGLQEGGEIQVRPHEILKKSLEDLAICIGN